MNMFRVIAYTVLVSIVAGAPCPSDWMLFDAGICIKSFKDKYPWILAHEQCLKKGANLMTFRNAFEYQAAREAVNANGNTACDHWIGLYTDGSYPQQFVWDDERKTPLGDMTKWIQGEPPQPVNAEDAEFSAVYMSYEEQLPSSYKGMWRTARDSALTNKNCFICSKKAEPPTTTTTTTLPPSYYWPFPRRDCQDVMEYYYIKTSGPNVIDSGETVYCDMQTLGGGWTTLMRRVDGAVNFHSRKLEEYRTFFGDVSKSHWQSLELMARLTQDNHYDLLVEAKGSRTLPYSSYYAYDLYQKHFAVTEGPTYTLYLFFGHSSGNLTSNLDFAEMADKSDFALHNGAGYSHGGWWLDMGKHKETDKVAYYLNGDYSQNGSNGMYVCQQTSETSCVLMCPQEVSMKIKRKAQYV